MTPERVPNPKKNHLHLGSLFDNFGVLGASIFWCFFGTPLGWHFGEFWCQSGSQKRAFGDHFGDYLATLRPYVESVIFDNTHALEPRSTLPRRLQNPTFWVLFLRPAWAVVLRTTFWRNSTILVSIWGSLGRPFWDICWKKNKICRRSFNGQKPTACLLYTSPSPRD